MIKNILKFVREPEPTQPLWGLPLPFGLTIAYVIAYLTALLSVTTWREDELTSPDGVSIIAAGILGGLLTIWFIRQNIRSAIIDIETQSKGKKSLKVAEALSMQESQSRELWLVWLAALSIAIALDAFALLVQPETTFPVGIDRLGDNIAWSTWLLVFGLFVIVRPIAEEFIFRGVLYPVLAQRFQDNFVAIYITAFLFTIYYFVQVFETDLRWGIVYWGLIYPFILGITAGIARAHTKSTWGAIGTHMMFGFFLFLKALLTLA